MTVCSLCLEIDLSVSTLDDSDQYKHIQEILTKHGFEPLDNCSNICYLCKHLLNKYYSFLLRIFRAQDALKNVMNNRSKKTKYEALKTLDRSKLNLNPNLSCHNVECFFVGTKIKEEKDDYYEDVYNQSENEASLNFIDVNSVKEESKIRYEFELFDIKKENKDNKSSPSKRKPAKPKYRYKPMPVEIMPSKLRRRTTRTTSKRAESDYSENENTSKNERKRRKLKPLEDDDYIPMKSESESEESSDAEIYDDKGKRMKKEDKRKYPMECEECDADIPSKKEHYHHYLCYHRDVEYPYAREAKFVCQICGVTRTSIHHLGRHEKMHGTRDVKCEQCEKKFFTHYHMKKHLRTHSKNYAFFCDYCNKGFHFKPDIVLHIRVHTGEKPFKCHICGAGFAHKGNVCIHIRTNHQGEPQRKKKNQKPNKNNNEKTRSKPKRKKKSKIKRSETSDSE